MTQTYINKGDAVIDSFACVCVCVFVFVCVYLCLIIYFSSHVQPM